MTANTSNEYKKITNGFTLMELLVVISIIALLLAIIFPALGKAREMANAVYCASNIRQISLAFNCYSIDNNGWIVMANDLRASDDGVMQAWNFLLIPYVDQKNHENAFEDKADVFFCPTDRDPYPLGYGSYWHDVPFTSYGLNGCFVEATPRRSGCKLGPASGQKFVDVKQASSCMLIFETSYSYQIYDMDNPSVSTIGLNQGGHHRQTSGFYHDGSMNILFVDGHVENIKGKQVEPITPCWETTGYMFWDDLSLPSSDENPVFWGLNYN